MRTNLPVTHREYPFPAGKTLVSTTDLKGRIIYCNPTFVEVSGFSKDELMGQSHNIVRHPDMPEEAFRDMWATIQSGLPWSGLVKNRRKNGDHYWVVANATPLLQEGKPVAYLSVRTEATREQIDGAEALYALMRQEKQAGRLLHVLSEGRVYKDDALGRFKRLIRLDEVGKLFAGLGFAWAAGWLAHAAVGGLEDAMGTSALIGMVVGGLATALVSWRLKTSLLDPVSGYVSTANALAAGDLTQRVVVTRTGVFGRLERALSQMSVNLMAIVRDARTECRNMQAATSEISAGNTDLSQRTETQASNLEETAASMEEITGTVGNSAEGARMASQLSMEALDTASHGATVVEEVAKTMVGIRDSSKRIADITQLIDGIAFQTNILALNAAVEAARAGEAGRGFAVVASEVRTLAQKSATAAKEIKTLIDESVNQVRLGNDKASAARDAMHQTLEKVQQVNTMIAEISNASREQLEGISQVNSAVSQLDSLTQQNAAMVEQIAASAQSLETQATTVYEAVAVFRVAGEPVHVPDAVALRKAGKGLE